MILTGDEVCGRGCTFSQISDSIDFDSVVGSRGQRVHLELHHVS